MLTTLRRPGNQACARIAPPLRPFRIRRDALSLSPSPGVVSWAVAASVPVRGYWISRASASHYTVFGNLCRNVSTDRDRGRPRCVALMCSMSNGSTNLKNVARHIVYSRVIRERCVFLHALEVAKPSQ